VNRRTYQKGITLIVSLIMLAVLTLIVVSAIRFGNINLKIAGNAQTEAEATAAAQVAIETMMKTVNEATKIDTVAGVPAMVVSTGGMTYTVNATKPACVLSRNIATTELDPSKPADRACVGGSGQDVIFDADGKPIPPPSTCKDQQWDIEAIIANESSGANVNMLQGVAVRVSAEVQCP
jgi:hypothetical protein